MDVIEQNGKPVFVGREDPTNPPVFVKNPMMRYCNRCRTENTNEKTECQKCGSILDDGKMQCPKCKKYFDFLLGEGEGMGCEADWKPVGKVETYDRPTGEVFD